MSANSRSFALRSVNRRKRSTHFIEQANYLASLPDYQDMNPLSNDSLSEETEDDEAQDKNNESDDGSFFGEFSDTESKFSEIIDRESVASTQSPERKLYYDVVISALLSKCRLTLAAAEMVVNLVNNVNKRFSNDPILLPSIRYFWHKRSQISTIGVYILCPNNHSHGPFHGEPSKYENFECRGVEIDAVIKNDKYFLHIPLRNQLENYLPTIPESNWVGTMEQRSISDTSNGKLAKGIKLSDADCDTEIRRITLTLHADEVQAGNSSNVHIFPIFVSINELRPDSRRKHFLLVGLFVGKVKPNVACYLGPICDELKSLEVDPISWKTNLGIELKSTFHVIGLVADAPMRAYLRGVRQYNHIYGCDWCLIQASSSRGARVFANLSEDRITQLKRTKDDFVAFERLQQINENALTQDQLSRFFGIVGGSPLMDLSSFNIVEGVAVEHMHCMVLGIFRSIVLKGWFGETQINIFEQNVDKTYLRKELSRRIIEISVPSDVTRPPRDLDQIKYWKSSEYDAFLCYYLFGSMKGLLKPRVINHLLCFVRIFQLSHCGPIDHDSFLELKNLIHEFQCGVEQIYGTSFMTYNLHILTHLPDSVINLGPTKNISSYPLENYMGLLKDKVRRSSNIAQSLVRIFINDFKYEEILHSVANWPISEKEKKDFGISKHSHDNNVDQVITIRENDFINDFNVVCESIKEKIDNDGAFGSYIFFKSVTINGKRFSTRKYGKDKIRCDSIIKSKAGQFMEISYLFKVGSQILALCETIDTIPVKINFKGFSDSFSFNLPHLFEIKRTNKDQCLVTLEERTKKCFIVPSTKFHFKYHKDTLVEPFLINH